MAKVKLLFMTLGFVAILLLALSCTGPAGPAGPSGPPGPQGPAGLAGTTVSSTTTTPATVVVSIGSVPASKPGDTVTIKATADIKDGSTNPTYKWTQTAGPKATIDNPASDTIKVTLANLATSKAEVTKASTIAGYPKVQPLSAGALRAGGQATFKVTVTTSSGSYSKTVNVTITLPWAATPDLANVPIGIPVMLSTKDGTSYSWSMTGPAGSTATLTDANTQFPYFTPAVVGKYTVKEASANTSVEVTAGKWAGAVSTYGADGFAESAACTACHNGKMASNNFDTWKKTGHAQVFHTAMTDGDHYTASCPACHTVGFNTLGAQNNSIINQSDYDAFIKSPNLNAEHTSSSEWPNMLKDFPKSMQFTGIQCENCHGPNDSALHMNGTLDAARINISTDVCSPCHSRPSNHIQVQEWQLSGHGNAELAREEGMSTSCARCHAGQGFLAWLPLLNAGQSGSLPSSAITWTADTAQPITCTTCHDPHDEGNLVTGEAKVRVMGDTAMLPSGFKGIALGSGALCATCHNTRNGIHDDTVKTAADDRAPHRSAQVDVLLGENAYFVTTGVRGGHANLENTCTTCHMQASPPPAPYTTAINHAFTASIEICADCHSEETSGENLKMAVEAKIETLKAALETAIMNEIKAQITAGNKLILVKLGDGGSDVTISDASQITSIELLESHGRQAMEIVVGGKTYDVRLSSDTKVGSGTLLTSAAGQKIAKAGWNLYLIEADSSFGIHNPSFALNVLTSSINALK